MTARSLTGRAEFSSAQVSPLRRALHTCQLSSGVGQTIVEVLPILAEQLSTPGDIGSHPRKLMTQFPMYAEELLKLSSEWQKDVCGPHRPSRSCESLASAAYHLELCSNGNIPLYANDEVACISCAVMAGAPAYTGWQV